MESRNTTQSTFFEVAIDVSRAGADAGANREGEVKVDRSIGMERFPKSVGYSPGSKGGHMALPKFAFFRGRRVPYSEAKVGVLTHGLNYGTGVFSGIRGYWNDAEGELFVFRPEDHFRRFLESGKMIGMELPLGPKELTNALLDLLRAEDFHEDCYARSLAFYADETVGVRLHDLTPEVSIVALP
jgi:hypothetical protein